jgi:hypothetical protein
MAVLTDNLSLLVLGYNVPFMPLWGSITVNRNWAQDTWSVLSWLWNTNILHCDLQWYIKKIDFINFPSIKLVSNFVNESKEIPSIDVYWSVVLLKNEDKLVYINNLNNVNKSGLLSINLSSDFDENNWMLLHFFYNLYWLNVLLSKRTKVYLFMNFFYLPLIITNYTDIKSALYEIHPSDRFSIKLKLT